MLDNICNGEYNTNRASILEISSVCEKSSRTTAVFVHWQRSSTSHGLYFAIPRYMIYFSVSDLITELLCLGLHRHLRSCAVY